MGLPLVSIILVGYNSKNHFDACFSSLKKINYPTDRYEVILADNNSQDGSVEYVGNKFKWVRVLPLDKNYGVAIAVNRGAKIAKGKYIVILNPDTEVEKNWLIELVDVMKNDKKIGACGSKLLYYDERDKINTIGGFWSILGFSGSLAEGMDKNQYNEIKNIFFPSGASLMIRKDLFLELGGYDEDYFMYVEDTDTGWKLWNLGYRVVFVPSSIVYHKVSASVRRGKGGGFRSMVYYHTTKNRLASIIKNAVLLDVVWMFPMGVISHIFEACVFLVRGRLDGFFAVVNGVFWVFLNFAKVLKKRGKIKHNRNANKLMLGPVESIKVFISKFRKHF